MHFAAPVLAVLAALGATVEAQRAVCSRKQYADVANSIQNPAYFCKFWLAEKRRGSVTPLKKYGVRSLTNLCKCFTQNSPRVRGPFKPLRPKAPPAGCPLSLYRPLRNQYKDPAQFCRWYNSVPRALSPLPAVPNPKAAVQACRCFLNKRFAPQQTTTTTTRRTTTTSRSTTTTTTTTTTDEPEVTSSTTSSGIFDGITASLTTTDFTLPTIFPTTTSADEETSTTTAAADETTTSSAAEDATTTTAEDASATDSTSSETATPTD